MRSCQKDLHLKKHYTYFGIFFVLYNPRHDKDGHKKEGKDMSEQTTSNNMAQENHWPVLVRSEEEKMHLIDVALTTPIRAKGWVNDRIRLKDDEFFALPIPARVEYLSSVKAAACATDETGLFWNNYLEEYANKTYNR